MSKHATIAIFCVFLLHPLLTWALASNNTPLDSPVYLHLEKLARFSQTDSDTKVLCTFPRAEGNLVRNSKATPLLAA